MYDASFLDITASQLISSFDVFLIIHFSTCVISGEKKKESALKEYQSLETTNKLLKAQVRWFSMQEIFEYGITLFVCKSKYIPEN